MTALDELRQERLRKLAILREHGMNPYPSTSSRDTSLETLLEEYDVRLESGAAFTVAGRIVSLRKHGKVIFFDLFDGTATVQVLFKEDEVGNEAFGLFEEAIDTGDFVEITGTAFTTKTGQKSVLARSWMILSKSLRAVPESWFGLKDEEERLRKRYLDILLNPEVRDLFEKKAIFWQSVREFLIKEGFLEVETPVLERTTGGADARPFKTHHNALDMDVYLRISAGELWQKELMVAGYPKVFEIGRIFRNEGISAEHAQDYTQMEFYMAYADYKAGMELVTRLYRYVAERTFGTQKFTIGQFEVDLSQEWQTYDYSQTIKEATGIDIATASEEDIIARLTELNVEYKKEGMNRDRAIDSLWKYCRKSIAGPGFLVGIPKELSPLAKADPLHPDRTERFQPIIAGSELGNGYSELNDPVDQAERFMRQAKMREAGDEEAQMFSDEFVEAIEYGMPPTCGYGMSERVFSFFANRPIRETQIFPLMRARSGEGKEGEEKDTQ